MNENTLLNYVNELVGNGQSFELASSYLTSFFVIFTMKTAKILRGPLSDISKMESSLMNMNTSIHINRRSRRKTRKIRSQKQACSS
jgi:fatty acid-binding protein DegV